MAAKDEKKIEVKLQPNQRLDLALTKAYTEQYSSRVEDVLSDAVVLAMPMSKGYPVMLQQGEFFYGRTVADGVVYMFTCTLLERKLSPLPIWKASLPTNVERVQQRSFVRVDATVPVRMAIEPAKAGEATLLLEATTKDISGGGAKIIYKHRLPAGTQMKLTLQLPEIGEVETEAQVVRTDKPQEDRPIHWVALRFINLHETVRSKIIKYVFKRQMELRQKGI